MGSPKIQIALLRRGRFILIPPDTTNYDPRYEAILRHQFKRTGKDPLAMIVPPAREAAIVCGLAACDANGTSDFSFGGRITETGGGIAWTNPENILIEGAIASVNLPTGADESKTIWLAPAVGFPYYSGILNYCYEYDESCTDPVARSYNVDADADRVSNLYAPVANVTVELDWEIRWKAANNNQSLSPSAGFDRVDTSTGCIVRQFTRGSFSGSAGSTSFVVQSGTISSSLINARRVVNCVLNIKVPNGFAGTVELDYFKTKFRYTC